MYYLLRICLQIHGMRCASLASRSVRVPIKGFSFDFGFFNVCFWFTFACARVCRARPLARRTRQNAVPDAAKYRILNSWRKFWPIPGAARAALARPGMRRDEAATIPARSWPPWRGRRCLSAIGWGRVRRPNPEPFANGSGTPGVLVAAFRCFQEGVCVGRGRNRWRTVWPLWRGRRCASAIPGRRVRRLRQQSLAVGTWLKLSWRDKPCSSARSGRRAQKLGP